MKRLKNESFLHDTYGKRKGSNHAVSCIDASRIHHAVEIWVSQRPVLLMALTAQGSIKFGSCGGSTAAITNLTT